MKNCFTVFLLIVFFSLSQYSVAVTFTPFYGDAPGEGFNDRTPLTDAQKAAISSSGNDAETLGEARKNALEEAFRILGNKLQSNITINVAVDFEPIPSSDPEIITLGGGRPTCFFSFSTGENLGIVYPPSLFKALYPDRTFPDCSEDNPTDIDMTFNDQPPPVADSSRTDIFYYGFDTGGRAIGSNFVSVVIHELFHGLGFSELVNENGSYPTNDLGPVPPSIYDYMLYSATHKDFLVNLSASRRANAITSGKGLLWDGRRLQACSYGQLVGRRDKTAGTSSDGRPILYAPSTYDDGGSVAHTDVSTTPHDIMEPFLPVGTRDMTLALALLKDMGWGINDSSIPVECTLPPPDPSNPDPEPPEPPINPTPGPLEPPIPAPGPLEPPIIPNPGPPLEPPTNPNPGPLEPPTSPTPNPPTPTSPEGGDGIGGCGIAGEEISSRNIVSGYLLLLLVVFFLTLHRKSRVAGKQTRRFS